MVNVAELNRISGDVVDAAYAVHVGLGPGLLESVYEAVLAHELNKRGRKVVRQQAIPVFYDGLRFEEGFRADLVVDDAVVVELKSVERASRVHEKQLLTYLRLMDRRLGLLLNFGEAYMKDGIVRVVNGLEE